MAARGARAATRHAGVPENPFLGSADQSSHVFDHDPPDRIRAAGTMERHSVAREDHRGRTAGASMMMTTGAKEAEIVSVLTGTTVNWVDNLAGLRAMAHATTAPVVVKGYVSAGDGGGGIFLWNDTSTLADNDGTIIRPNDVAPWRRLTS